MFIIRLYNTSDIPLGAAAACPADLSSRRVGKRKDMPTPIREEANVLRIYKRIIGFMAVLPFFLR